VQVDHQGKCFNCISPAHRAAECRSHPHCFWCQEIGHYSYKCVSLSSELALPTRRSTCVWHPVSSNNQAQGTMNHPELAAAAPHQAAAAAGVGGQEGHLWRRRHRVWKRRGSQGLSGSAPAGTTDEEVRAALPAPVSEDRPLHRPTHHQPLAQNCESERGPLHGLFRSLSSVTL
jgi:hypothetical protein